MRRGEQLENALTLRGQRGVVGFAVAGGNPTARANLKRLNVDRDAGE
jgi:hypothetical protein